MRKGITPIVSVVLLLLITIALAGGVLVWLTGYVGGLQQDILLKGTTCLRVDAGKVTFRGYLQNTLDSPLLKNKVSISQLTGPTTVTLSSTTIPSSDLSAGNQVLFTVDGTATDVKQGTYTLEFASDKTVQKATFSCP